MWDKPDALNLIANVLFAAAALLLAYGVLHFAMRLPFFPLREIRITEAPLHVTPEQIEAIVVREIKGNIFTLDLERTRAAFEKLPWVRAVNVRRQWPDRLDVSFEEHVPLGRWSPTALVNTYGELFTAAYDGTLPSFVGPAGSEKEIAIQYGYFKRSLAAIKLVPTQVQVSPRRAWQLRVSTGTTLQLGRDNIEPRLDRFVSVYERTLGRLQRRIGYVDLRYPNGFAVGIPELMREQTDKPAHKSARAAG